MAEPKYSESLRQMCAWLLANEPACIAFRSFNGYRGSITWRFDTYRESEMEFYKSPEINNAKFFAAGITNGVFEPIERPAYATSEWKRDNDGTCYQLSALGRTVAREYLGLSPTDNVRLWALKRKLKAVGEDLEHLGRALSKYEERKADATRDWNAIDQEIMQIEGHKEQ